MATETADAQPPPPNRVEVLGNIGPNWFASVMGTGIVAVAGATLPVHVLGLRAFAEAVWVLAGAMVSTAMRVVNAIPYVVEAKPGLLSALDLPLTLPRHVLR
jgi:hypothetical protein